MERPPPGPSAAEKEEKETKEKKKKKAGKKHGKKAHADEEPLPSTAGKQPLPKKPIFMTGDQWVSLSKDEVGVNSISAKVLALELEADTVTCSLDLQRGDAGNHVEDAGATALAAALRVNTTLQFLDLTSNRIRDAGASELARALETNSTLLELRLRGNHITDAGITALSEALKTNVGLTCLDLESQRLDEGKTADGVRHMLRTLKFHNFTLMRLHLAELAGLSPSLISSKDRVLLPRSFPDRALRRQMGELRPFFLLLFDRLNPSCSRLAALPLDLQILIANIMLEPLRERVERAWQRVPVRHESGASNSASASASESSATDSSSSTDHTSPAKASLPSKDSIALLMRSLAADPRRLRARLAQAAASSPSVSGAAGGDAKPRIRENHVRSEPYSTEPLPSSERCSLM